MSSFLQSFSLDVCRRWMRMGVLLAVAGMAAGCATVKVLEPAQAAAIKNVGVISLLPGSVLYQKIGITVFNNERVEKPAGTALDDAARAGAESAFKGVNRNVKQLAVDAAQVKELFRPGAIVFSWPPDKARAFLVDSAKQNGLDAIAVVHEVFDSDNGYAGVRYFLRGGFNSIERHGIRADTEVTLYNAKGDVVISRSAGLGALYAVERPGGKPWAYKIDESLDPATHEQVLSFMKKIIESKTAGHVQAMGL
ncbi:MAG: hypothetical protein V4718_03745 [Pseudomonadota bacterium]